MLAKHLAIFSFASHLREFACLQIYNSTSFLNSFYRHYLPRQCYHNSPAMVGCLLFVLVYSEFTYDFSNLEYYWYLIWMTCLMYWSSF